MRSSGCFVSLLVLGAILGLNALCKSQAKSNDTKVNEASFRLTLPGPWKSGNADDSTLRSYHTEKEQLTVSIFCCRFGAAGQMNHDEKVAEFPRWVNKRRNIETKMPGYEGVVLTESMFGESKGTLAARYEGFDPARKRRFHCMLLASSSAFEIFYYEAVDSTEQTAKSRAKLIFNSVDTPK
ncbi:MAG TPA: hypothetical protein VFE61_24435 [Candidatus Sulfotelmatobacter sp.]|nr:hypothetical protein [Candidatus Sulfotelmatobacter sp.]